MKTYEQKARAYASTNFAVQCSDVPAVVLDISNHLKRCYMTAVRETLEGLWISVKDELPKDGEEVIIAIYNTFYKVRFYKDNNNSFTREWGGKHENYFISDGITHWMRPILPKDLIK